MEIKKLYGEEEIQNRIYQMAEEIDREYEGKEIVAICVLRGAVYFMTDITRKMKTPMQLDFIRATSYQGTESTGKIEIIDGIKENIEGKHVLVIEDIIDTGYTLKYLKEYLLSKNPASLKIAVLINKPARREAKCNVDFVGFDIENKFIVGYGFDLDGSYRNLPYIGYISKS